MQKLGCALALLCVFSCGKGKQPSEQTQTKSEPKLADPAPSQPAQADEATAPAKATEPAIRVDGFETPESILFDADRDLYYVSNIAGKPTDVDGNGFLSKVNPDGSVADRRWIEGLDAPKGMTIWHDMLWVADISKLRKFDIVTGEARGVIEIKGATFLNDVTHTDDAVYVSDTGVDKDFKGLGNDAIYAIDKDDKVETFVANPELHGPNGVTAHEGALYMVTFGAAELNLVNKGGVRKLAELPTGGLDGIEFTAEDAVVVSSWECGCVYAGPLKGPFVKVIDKVESPADIGWDARRRRVLIPLFNENAIAIQALP